MTFQKEIGDYGENLVCENYKKRGYKIIGRNIVVQGYKQLGELDIIAQKSKELVFVEVKTRSSDAFMDPIEAISWRKVKRLRGAILGFISQNSKYDNYNMRVDIAIVNTQLDEKNPSVIIVEDSIQDLA